MNRNSTVRSLILVSLAISALPCAAQDVGDLCLQVDPGLEATLLNPSNAPIAFDGYTLACEVDGCLDPNGWVSIVDSVAADASFVIAELGLGALSFGEAGVPNDHQLSELNIAGQAVLQPGATWRLGHPFPLSARDLMQAVDSGALTFTLSGRGIVLQAGIECMPEPSSLALAAFGAAGCGLFVRRKLSRRQSH